MMSKEMDDAIQTIRDFLENKGGIWDWDDFLSCPAREPQVRELQGFCLGLHYEFPPSHKAEYCNEEGFRKLRKRLEELEKRT
jgi:hypothetical protein